MRITVLAILATHLLCGCSYINKKIGVKNDHIVEETAETIIERYLGLHEETIDLS